MLNNRLAAHADAPVAYPVALGELPGVACHTVEPESLHAVATVMEGERRAAADRLEIIPIRR